MSITSFVQDKILLPRKWKNYKLNRPPKQFIGLHQAKKIGIIADFRETSLVRIVADFHKKIKNDEISLSLAGLLQDERNNFNQFEYERQFPGSLVYLVASDEVNRWGQVRTKVIQPFLDQQYDIVFFLDRNPSFTMMDIVLSTRSKMVAGRISEEREIVDFGIELDASAPLDKLTNNLYKYLVSIGVNRKEKEVDEPKKDLRLF